MKHFEELKAHLQYLQGDQSVQGSLLFNVWAIYLDCWHIEWPVKNLKALPLLTTPTVQIKIRLLLWEWWHRPVLPALGRWGQESSRSFLMRREFQFSWAIWHPVSESRNSSPLGSLPILNAAYFWLDCLIGGVFLLNMWSVFVFVMCRRTSLVLQALLPKSVKGL